MCKGQGRKPKLNNRDLRSLRRHCIKNPHLSISVFYKTSFKCSEKEWQHYKVVNALLSQLFLECVAGLNDRKGCIFTNDMKLTRQNMKYFVFILSAMKYKSKSI